MSEDVRSTLTVAIDITSWKIVPGLAWAFVAVAALLEGRIHLSFAYLGISGLFLTMSMDETEERIEVSGR